MERFAKMERFILNVWQSSEYTSSLIWNLERYAYHFTAMTKTDFLESKQKFIVFKCFYLKVYSHKIYFWSFSQYQRRF